MPSKPATIIQKVRATRDDTATPAMLPTDRAGERRGQGLKMADFSFVVGIVELPRTTSSAWPSGDVDEAVVT